MSWLIGWSYRKSHTINYAAGAGTNYQKKITVHYGSGSDSGEDVYLDSKCRTDFGDIRFTDNDEETELYYWMEEKVDSDYAIFWVKVADDLSSSNVDIYIYYGNAEASTTSNIKTASMFNQGDDFNDNTRDTGLWDTVIVGTGSPTEVNQRLEMDVSTSGDMAGYVSVNAKTLNTVAMKVRAYNPLPQTVDLVICLTKVIGNNYFDEQNWYRIMLYHNGGNKCYVQKKVDGGVTMLYSGNFIAEENNLEIRIEDSIVKFFEGTTERASESWSLSSRNCYIYLVSRGYSFNVGTTWEDAFWIRKYVSPEPSHGAWGSEETEGTPIPVMMHHYNRINKKIRG